MPPPSGKARRRAANAAGAAKPVAEGAPAQSDPPRRRPPPSPRPSRTGDASSLVGITCFVAAQYGAWLSYYWLHLQSGLLRAPVGPTQPRQLLVVCVLDWCPTERTQHATRLPWERQVALLATRPVVARQEG